MYFFYAVDTDDVSSLSDFKVNFLPSILVFICNYEEGFLFSFLFLEVAEQLKRDLVMQYVRRFSVTFHSGRVSHTNATSETEIVNSNA